MYVKKTPLNYRIGMHIDIKKSHANKQRIIFFYFLESDAHTIRFNHENERGKVIWEKL